MAENERQTCRESSSETPAKIVLLNRRQTLGDFLKGAKVTGNRVRFNDVASGVDVGFGTNGAAFVINPSNVCVQTSATSVNARDFDGEVKWMDTSKMTKTVQSLSDAVAKEAKYWISIMKSD